MSGGNSHRVTRCYARVASGPKGPGRSGWRDGVSGPRRAGPPEPKRPLPHRPGTPSLHDRVVRVTPRRAPSRRPDFPTFRFRSFEGLRMFPRIPRGVPVHTERADIPWPSNALVAHTRPLLHAPDMGKGHVTRGERVWRCPPDDDRSVVAASVALVIPVSQMKSRPAEELIIVEEHAPPCACRRVDDGLRRDSLLRRREESGVVSRGPRCADRDGDAGFGDGAYRDAVAVSSTGREGRAEADHGEGADGERSGRAHALERDARVHRDSARSGSDRCCAEIGWRRGAITPPRPRLRAPEERDPNLLSQ